MQLFEFEVADYRVVSCQPEAQVASLLVNLLSGELDFEQVYRSNRHSFCARFVVGDDTCMLKRPVGRNRRYWERFLTLFRPGEGRRTFDSFVLLRKLGFIGPEPWFAAEKRKSGMVVESFVVYRFLDGVTPGKEDTAAVLDVLLRLHDLGYVALRI